MGNNFTKPCDDEIVPECIVHTITISIATHAEIFPQCHIYRSPTIFEIL